ncbi:hypothetical protein DFJ64_1224 [Thermasporomyces composti]|uniref:Uncharacterized protein n=1 Tax=Thermasporomyces composti TaxID=696763 RepID=A0A3D9V219_THECX|nr:hypothetical protein DFJ64_1224 [Thermasporomyces composti]
MRLSTLRPFVGPTLRTLAVAAGTAAVLSLVATGLFRWSVPYPLILALVLAVLLGARIASGVRAPARLASPVREDVEGPRYGVPDRPFADVRRWEQLLELVHGDGEYFRRSVLPAIGDLVDERLRTAHGITRASDPERARDILGHRVWTFLETGVVPTRVRASRRAGSGQRIGVGGDRPPSPAELAALVGEIERRIGQRRRHLEEDVWKPRP